MQNSSRLRIGLIVTALFFFVAGLNHFINPAIYLSMMPAYLPWPSALQLISGVAEIAGAVGLLIPRVRRLAGWGLVGLLIAVFPANLHVALNGWPQTDFPSWVLWARLPLQGVMIWWVLRITRPITPAAESQATAG